MKRDKKNKYLIISLVIIVIILIAFVCFFVYNKRITGNLISNSASQTLPEIEICKPQKNGNNWIETFPINCFFKSNCDSIIFRCKQLAKEGDKIEYVRKTSDNDYEVDCKGEPLRIIAFISDGYAGEMRYNKNTCNKESNNTIASLVLFSGLGGTAWVDAARNQISSTDPNNINDNSIEDNDYRAFENYGVRLISIKWKTSAKLSTLITGWWTKKSSNPIIVSELAKRPTSIVKYIGQNIAPKNAKFGVAGTSGGSLQTASVLLYNIEREVDYLGMHSGGGIFYDLNTQCGAVPSMYRINEDTGEICDKGDSCPENYGKPLLISSIRLIPDYIHSSKTCLNSQTNQLQDLSSFIYANYTGTIPKKAGFIVNSKPTSNPPEMDNIIGAVYAAGMMKQLLYEKTGILGDWQNGEGIHGDCMKSGHPSFALFKEQVLNAFEINKTI